MSRIVVNCARGTADYLKEEFVALDFPVVSETSNSIETRGSLDDAMKLNLHIRTGQRVLFFLKQFNMKNIDGFYKEIKGIRWEDYIHRNGYFCVTSSVESTFIQDTRYANLKCKDAIVDRFTEMGGIRPDSGAKKDRVVIFLYWRGRTCSVYIDTSGVPLSRRSYRKTPLRAPMQESLAAAVIMATRWNGSNHFISPMCGSGTLAIEAALIALNRAPGLLRKNFSFMHLKDFEAKTWKSMRRQAMDRSKKKLRSRIIATDRNAKAVMAAKKNAADAGVEDLIEFGICDFQDTEIPEDGGVVVINPDYGERVGDIKELEGTYKRIGDFFKKKCQGYYAYLFTGNIDLGKKVGLRTKRRIPFFNGPIECRLLEYELYQGSRRI